MVVVTNHLMAPADIPDRIEAAPARFSAKPYCGNGFQAGSPSQKPVNGNAVNRKPVCSLWQLKTADDYDGQEAADRSLAGDRPRLRHVSLCDPVSVGPCDPARRPISTALDGRLGLGPRGDQGR